MTLVPCGTGRTCQPFGALPLYGSRSPAFPVTGSRWRVSVGPAAFTHTVFVFVTVFFFLPAPVVVFVFTFTGLKSAYPLGLPPFADACTRESRSCRFWIATGWLPLSVVDGGTRAGSRPKAWACAGLRWTGAPLPGRGRPRAGSRTDRAPASGSPARE